MLYKTSCCFVWFLPWAQYLQGEALISTPPPLNETFMSRGRTDYWEIVTKWNFSFVQEIMMWRKVRITLNSMFLVMNVITADPSDPGRISLAYRDLSELPEGWNSKLGDHINVLDLSHNNFSYPFWLGRKACCSGVKSGLNCRILGHFFASNWIWMDPFDSIHFILQLTGYSKIAPKCVFVFSGVVDFSALWFKILAP